MRARLTGSRNRYRCAVEKNQAGKFCVRVQARFARHAWDLSVWFLASSFDQGMRKLQQSLRFLQRNEERLWFWGVDRSDDPNLSGELLNVAGLKLDKRGEFPRQSALLVLAPDRMLGSEVLSPIRRDLSQSLEGGRLASD